MADTNKMISDHPEWFTLSDYEKNQAADAFFTEKVASRDDFKNLDTDTQAQVKEGFQQQLEAAAINSQHNPDAIRNAENQRDSDANGFFWNVPHKAGKSLVEATERVTLLDDTRPGATPDQQAAGTVAKILQKRIHSVETKAQKEFGADIALLNKRREKDGVLNDAVAWAHFAGDVITNPKALVELAAESASSLASGYIGAKTGAGVGAFGGSVFGPVGTAAGAKIGAGVGMFTGMAQDAMTHKMISEVDEALKAKNLPPTPENVQALFNDEAWLSYSQKKAATYGSLLGIAETVIGGIVGRISTLSTRAARRAAVKELDKTSKAILSNQAQKAGMSVTDYTEASVNHLARLNLKNRTLGRKTTDKTVAVGLEVAGEPATEAIATAGVGDEITAEDLIYETAGGLGSGPISTAISTSAFGTKLAKDKTGEFKDKILADPETKTARQKNKEELKAAKKQTQARAEHGYKQTVTETDPDDTVVNDFADPQNEAYDPIKAVEILSKSDAIDKTDRIAEVKEQFRTDTKALVQEMQDLVAQAETDGEWSQQNKERHDFLQEKLVPQRMETFRKLQKFEEISERRAAVANENKEVDQVDPGDTDDTTVTKNVTETLGSHANKADLKNEQIQNTLDNNPDLAPEVKGMLEAKMAANLARAVVETNAKQKTDTSGKTQEAVSNDIYRGKSGDDFKGILGYQQRIAHALAKGDLQGAQKQIEGLKKFADQHAAKAGRLSAALKQAQNSGIKYGSGQEIQVPKGDGSFWSIHQTSDSLVNNVVAEADALTKEVVYSESVIAAQNVKGTQKTKPKTQPKTAPKTERTATQQKKDEAKNFNEAWKRAKVHAKKMVEAGATQEQIQKAAKQLQNKFHPAMAKAYLQEIKLLQDQKKKNQQTTERTDEPVVAKPDATPEPEVTPDDAQSEPEVLTQIELSEAAAATLTDYEANSAQTDQKVNKDGFKEKNRVNLNADAHPWTQGHTKTAVVGMLRRVAEGKPIPQNATAQQNAYDDFVAYTENLYQKPLEQKSETTPLEENATNNTAQNESTSEEQTDTLTGTESNDLGSIEITFTDASGNEVTQSYNEAIADIEQQLEEAQNIINCCLKK